jgi:hypothetical protein
MLVVIGAQRCGTSYLFRRLARHPRIVGASVKEVHYFDLHHKRGMDWYRRQFPRRGRLLQWWRGAPLCLEATPYYLFHPHVPERIAAALPQARFVALLREPATRAHSHYRNQRRKGSELLSFADALRAEPERTAADWRRMLEDPDFESRAVQLYSYRARGRYAEQLERWFATVPRDRVLVLEAEALYREEERVLREIYDFAGIPFVRLPPAGAFRNAAPESKEPADCEALEVLRGEFAADNARLRALLGKTLSWM